MNTDKETNQRFKRKLLNACNVLDGLVEFIQVHNEDDESAKYRRAVEMQGELEATVKTLDRLFINFLP